MDLSAFENFAHETLSSENLDKRAVWDSNTSKLAGGGERKTFWQGSLIAFFLRTKKEKEENRTTNLLFLTALRNRYKSLHNTREFKELESEFSDRIKWGKPLTGYRISQTLRKANLIEMQHNPCWEGFPRATSCWNFWRKKTTLWIEQYNYSGLYKDP